MSDLHRGHHFETEICESLAAHGWLYAKNDASNYDRTLALFPDDVIGWIQQTQPKAWEVLTKNHGALASEVLCKRLRASIDQHGTLAVLRHGIELLGLRQALRLAQFKPALAMNAEIIAHYQANRLRIVRQVRYSLHNENSLDLVFFLNGIPVATIELKSDFTQSVEDAVDQYRFDRQPRPKGQSAAEPLLSFPNGAVVHFAVSHSEAMMTTKLEGPVTHFLPFNRGDHGAAGNPSYTPSPHPLSHRGRGATSGPLTCRMETQSTPLSSGRRGAGGEVIKNGFRTAYLWEQIWERESWLEILGRYLVAHKDSRKQISKIIFPRFHQLDATRKLLQTVLQEGAGGKYLIQHSAGSGKTNSIAWTAGLPH